MTNPAIDIRPMSDADIPAIADLEIVVFSDSWPAVSFHEALDDPMAFNLVASPKGGDTVCAYLCAQIVFDEIHIHNIAVAPESRRRGIGKGLLEYAEAAGRKRGADCALLEVRVDNAPALALYGRLGYRRIGRRRRYYRNPICDALVLLKILDESRRGKLAPSGSPNGVVS